MIDLVAQVMRSEYGAAVALSLWMDLEATRHETDLCPGSTDLQEIRSDDPLHVRYVLEHRAVHAHSKL